MNHGLDPGNISKMERGLASPPQSKEKLEEYAQYLGIAKDTDDWSNFFDYASAATGRIPPDVMSDEELVKKLPLVFRTLRGQKLPIEKLGDLGELIRRT
jgi:transcriptional regulator with XRE-family HTH domain